ncbi:helix-turn-helix transcriptional regulator [bacterium]|nr:helix-turn-helix transcriptional regulator [bacterium]
MATAPASDALHEMDALTKRQREVLSLAAKGMTNPEIGDRLGISKDGAKWHIGEILMRLNVDTREEAVDLWKRYNGLPYRLHRVVRAVLGPLAVRWALGGVAAAAVTGLAVALVVLATQDSDHPKAGVTPPAATTAATPAASPTPESLDGIRVVPAHVGDAVSFPKDLVVYAANVCQACDVPPVSVQRFSYGPDGVQTDTVYKLPGVHEPGQNDEGTTSDGKYITSAAVSQDGAGLAVGVCEKGYCGGVGNVTADAEVTVYGSADGGITWTSIGAVNGQVSILSANASGEHGQVSAFVRATAADGSTKYVTLPGGTVVSIGNGQGTDSVFSMSDTNPAYVSADGQSVISAFDGPSNGSSLAPTLPPNSKIIGASMGGGLKSFAVSWQTTTAGKTTAYTGLMEGRTGKPGTAISWGQRPGWLGDFTGGWIDPTHLVASVDVPSDVLGAKTNGPVLAPAIVDMTTGAIQPLSGLGTASRALVVLSATSGPFAIVHGAGDCLYVRATPSSSGQSLGCYKDNVLLRERGFTQDADGHTWVAVYTPGSDAGWAASDYLQTTGASKPATSQVYPSGRRTGNSNIDPVLAAIESADPAKLIAATEYMQIACVTNPQGIGAPPTCPTGAAAGTIIEVIPGGSGEGTYTPRADYEKNPVVPGVGLGLYAIYRNPAGYQGSPEWPVGDFTIVYLDPGNLMAASVAVSGGKIVNRFFAQPLTAALRNAQPSDFILPPKTP